MVAEFLLFESVEFQISLLLAVSLVAYFVARTLNQPVVIGQLIVGILLGPSLLNAITYTDFVSKLASMGAIFLLFVVGLQTKFREILNFKSFSVAFLGVVLPWVGGFLTAEFFGFDFVSSIFAGTALTATSIAITAQVLKEMGRLKSDAAKTIIGAAVVDDVLSLLALSLTTQFASGNVSLEGIGFSAASAVLFVVAAVMFGRFAAKQLERLNKWEERHKTPAMTFLAAISLAFFYSLAAELAGLSAIVGAFLAGVSLESVKIKSYREGAEYLEMVFASIFFVSLGVLVNLRQEMPVLFVAALAVVALLTKFLGGFVVARLFGSTKTDSLAIGIGMAPRGEIAFIVALLGLNAGVISQPLYASLVLVSLVTTLVAPLGLKWVYSSGN